MTPVRVIAALFLICLGAEAARAESWAALQFRVALPIPYLVDVDSLRSDQAVRSLAGKWILSPDIQATGAWQFDCRARAWRAERFLIHRNGAQPGSVATTQLWHSARPGSAFARLLDLICAAPADGGPAWLKLQLQSAAF